MTRSRRNANWIVAFGTAALLGSGVPLHAGSDIDAASLVSPDEASASAKAYALHPEGPELSTEKALTLGGQSDLAPKIEVLEPKLGASTTPPFDVRVVARPRDGQTIDRSSIRIRYGFFRIDITQRMLSLGRWQGNEFIVSRAKAPTGTHWFHVTLADTARQTASVSVKVVVK